LNFFLNHDFFPAPEEIQDSLRTIVTLSSFSVSGEDYYNSRFGTHYPEIPWIESSPAATNNEVPVAMKSEFYLLTLPRMENSFSLVESSWSARTLSPKSSGPHLCLPRRARPRSNRHLWQYLPTT